MKEAEKTAWMRSIRGLRVSMSTHHRIRCSKCESTEESKDCEEAIEFAVALMRQGWIVKSRERNELVVYCPACWTQDQMPQLRPVELEPVAEIKTESKK